MEKMLMNPATGSVAPESEWRADYADFMKQGEDGIALWGGEKFEDGGLIEVIIDKVRVPGKMSYMYPSMEAAKAAYIEEQKDVYGEDFATPQGDDEVALNVFETEDGQRYFEVTVSDDGTNCFWASLSTACASDKNSIFEPFWFKEEWKTYINDPYYNENAEEWYCSIRDNA